jgi:adenylate kinase
MNIVLIGPPGSGKGTLAAILGREHGWRRLASGDLLRAAVRAGAPLGQAAKGFMDRGDLVPDRIVIDLMLERVREWAVAGVIFDGFPRTPAQACALEAALAALGQRIDRVAYLDVPRPVLIRRLTRRYQCADCGAIYNWGTQPPAREGLCDHCGGGLSQRLDDNERIIERRLQTYLAQTLPLIRHFEAAGRLCRVDGDRPVDQVTAQILAAAAGRGDEAALVAAFPDRPRD